MEAFENLKKLIAEVEEDIGKAEGGNRAAGTQIGDHRGSTRSRDKHRHPPPVGRYAAAMRAHDRGFPCGIARSHVHRNAMGDEGGVRFVEQRITRLVPGHAGGGS